MRTPLITGLACILLIAFPQTAWGDSNNRQNTKAGQLVPSMSGYKNANPKTQDQSYQRHPVVNRLAHKRQSDKARAKLEGSIPDNSPFWDSLKQGTKEQSSRNQNQSFDVRSGWYNGGESRGVGGGTLSKERATISCWATLKSRKELFKYLDQMADLRKKTKVKIGEFVVFNRESENKQLLKEQIKRDRKLSADIHFGKINEREAAKIAFKPRGIKNKMKELGAKWTGLLSIDEVVHKLGVKSSPVWLISVDGKIHVFEGEYYPAHLLSADGHFRTGDFSGLKRKPDPSMKDLGDFVLYRRKNGTPLLHNRKNYPGNGFIYSFN